MCGLRADVADDGETARVWGSGTNPGKGREMGSGSRETLAKGRGGHRALLPTASAEVVEFFNLIPMQLFPPFSPFSTLV